jgi:hypothetical protein
LEQAVHALAHEIAHPYQDRKKLNQGGNPKRLSREDYIKSQVANEVYADNLQHQIYSELADKSKMTKPYGQDAWETADPADRDRMIEERYIGPNAVNWPSTLGPGHSYDEIYGPIWDKANRNRRPSQ